MVSDTKMVVPIFVLVSVLLFSADPIAAQCANPHPQTTVTTNWLSLGNCSSTGNTTDGASCILMCKGAWPAISGNGLVTCTGSTWSNATAVCPNPCSSCNMNITSSVSTYAKYHGTLFQSLNCQTCINNLNVGSQNSTMAAACTSCCSATFLPLLKSGSNVLGPVPGQDDLCFIRWFQALTTDAFWYKAIRALIGVNAAGTFPFPLTPPYVGVCAALGVSPFLPNGRAPVDDSTCDNPCAQNGVSPFMNSTCEAQPGQMCSYVPGVAPKFKCACKPGYTNATGTCLDIDECTFSPCDPATTWNCTNSAGDFKCLCNTGMVFATGSKTVCVTPPPPCTSVNCGAASGGNACNATTGVCYCVPGFVKNPSTGVCMASCTTCAAFTYNSTLVSGCAISNTSCPAACAYATSLATNPCPLKVATSDFTTLMTKCSITMNKICLSCSLNGGVGNGMKDFNETDIDCGGPATGCSVCAEAQSCLADTDCFTGYCKFGVCSMPAGKGFDKSAAIVIIAVITAICVIGGGVWYVLSWQAAMLDDRLVNQMQEQELGEKSSNNSLELDVIKKAPQPTSETDNKENPSSTTMDQGDTVQ